MAVPFHVPHANAPSTSAVSSTTTTTSSATMTAPQPQNPTTTTTAAMSPVNSEYLVQAFCEALYRYSRAGGSLTAPPSPSPSCTTEMFFNFNSHLDDLSSPSPPSRRYRSNSLSCPLPPHLPRHRFNSRHRQEMTDDDDTDENFTETNYMEEHYHNYMAERERLQEFPGRVPHQRKRKATDSEHNPQQQQQQCEGREDEEEEVKNKPKELKFASWQLVALGVLAVGCGILATTR